MFQFAFESALFAFKQERPAFAPLFRLPTDSHAGTGKARRIAL
jgi:hypothetical protein